MHFLARKMINTNQKLGLGVSWNERASSEKISWQQQLAKELHKPITRDFTRQRGIVNDVDEIWAAELVDMQKFNNWNKGYKYLLMVIEVFSKYGRIKPIKDKKGETVTETFKSIFKEGRQPRYVWVDKGKEFYDKHFKEFLDKKIVKIYSTEKWRKIQCCLKMKQNSETENVETVYGLEHHTATHIILTYYHK